MKTAVIKSAGKSAKFMSNMVRYTFTETASVPSDRQYHERHTENL
jgi:hypothetical protein